MGRRALPRIDASLDLSQHLFELSDIANGSAQALRPSALGDRAILLPAARPLEVEIGSGKGLFLLNESAARPDTDFLGVEISKKYCRFAAYRLAKAGRTNARMIRGDGMALLRDLLPLASVAAVHIYFPDPWWKARHRRRRVVQDDTIPLIARVLVPGGRFHFWTDVEEYFQTGCDAIAASDLFAGPYPDQPGDSSEALETGSRFQTHFERRMLLHDHDVFRARFERLANPAFRTARR